MEENALIANIATILTKDLLMDGKKGTANLLKSSSRCYSTLLDSTDSEGDEPFSFFMRQKHSLKKSQPSTRLKQAVKKAGCPTKTPKGIIKRRAPTGFDELKFKVIKLRNPNNKSGKTIKPNPTIDSSSQYKYPDLNLAARYEDTDFEQNLHVSKTTFLHVFQGLCEVFTLGSKVSPQTAFSLSMWKLTTDEHFEAISQKFEIPLADCQRIIRRFWHNVSDKYESFIKWPNSLATQQRTLDGFQGNAELKCFQELFGIISIKCLHIFLESEDADVSVICQIVCNAERKIIDCFVELAQDYNFDNSPIGQTLAWNSRTMPAGSYLIGNECFPLKAYLIRPIESECFRKDAVFNQMLAPAFKLADDALDMMAMRFNTLYALEARDLSEVRQIFETICSLHNLCIDNKDNYFDRKKELANSNWASSADLATISGSEKDPKGLSRRGALIDNLVHL